jgi:hypothetical protein
MKEIIFDTSTNEVIERPLSDVEISEKNQLQEKMLEKVAIFDFQIKQKEDILKKLGLTEDEAKLLLG